MNDKVGFLIVGAQKSGTSALDNYLRKHSQILMAKRKECHFFDNDNYDSVNYKKYHKLFNGFESSLLKGECTPVYMYWPNSIERIYKYNSNIKIIAVLRNPIKRAYSAWNMLINLNVEKLSFSEAIRDEKDRILGESSKNKRLFSYVDRGFYSEQIKRIWRFFSKDQTLFLKYDDFKEDLVGTMNKVTNFLEVEPFKNMKYQNVNSINYTSNMSLEDREYLESLYKHEINQLEKMLEWDCKSWLRCRSSDPI